ncbi:MAG: FecCD family ABC transporter permease [Desulfobulbus sp.]
MNISTSCLADAGLPTRRRFKVLPWYAVLPCGLAAALLVAVSMGNYATAPAEIVTFLLQMLGLGQLDNAHYAALYNILVEIRLPRILAAMLVGSSLAVSGAAFQAVFRNPLVSPGLLGVQSGAAFGAALAILCGWHWSAVQGLSFAMGLSAVGVSVLIANAFGHSSLVMLVLGGIISCALFSSLVTVIKYVADPLNVLPSIVYWLMGNLGAATLDKVLLFSGPLLFGVLFLSCCGRFLDALSMGDDEARSLGVPVGVVRYAVIAVTTMISALTVSLAGNIGWIGLLIPHVVRLTLGPANTRVLPASALAGALFLVVADGCARCVTVLDIPIGIVTELLGIPAFLLVVNRARKGWVG